MEVERGSRHMVMTDPYIWAYKKRFHDAEGERAKCRRVGKFQNATRIIARASQISFASIDLPYNVVQRGQRGSLKSKSEPESITSESV